MAVIISLSSLCLDTYAYEVNEDAHTTLYKYTNGAFTTSSGYNLIKQCYGISGIRLGVGEFVPEAGTFVTLLEDHKEYWSLRWSVSNFAYGYRDVPPVPPVPTVPNTIISTWQGWVDGSDVSLLETLRAFKRVHDTYDTDCDGSHSGTCIFNDTDKFRIMHYRRNLSASAFLKRTGLTGENALILQLVKLIEDSASTNEEFKDYLDEVFGVGRVDDAKELLDLLDFYRPYIDDEYSDLSAFESKIRSAYDIRTDAEILTEASERKSVLYNDLLAKLDSTEDTFQKALINAQLRYLEETLWDKTDRLVSMDGLSNLQKAWVYSILCLPGMDQSVTDIQELQNFFDGGYSSSDTSSGYTGASEEAAATALEEFKSILLENQADSGLDMSIRMLTFDSRVRYLYNVMQVDGSTVDADIKDYLYGQPAVTQCFYPEIAYLSFSDSAVKVRNAEAYVCLLATVMELSYYSDLRLPAMANALQNGTISSIGKWINRLITVKKGISYINCSQVDQIWAEEVEASDSQDPIPKEYNSLEKIYNALQAWDLIDKFMTYDESELTSAFSEFFSVDEGLLSTYMLEGISLSAMYLPMQTNVYNALTIQLSDNEEFINEFHYKYGFHRKALYIDTNVDAAVDYFRTGRTGTLKVATLEDLMYADKDIVLYIDDNFYNMDELSELQGETFDRLDNVDMASDALNWWDRMWQSFKDFWEADPVEIAKSAENTQYDARLASLCAQYDGVSSDAGEGFILSSADISYYTSKNEYSVLQSFAFVSGLYRDKSDLFNIVQQSCQNPEPVFISSPKLPFIAEADSSARNTVFNYMLLKNLEANTPIGYNTNLDMTSAIYMDIYGNIVTESGLVVVPAASNATLHESDYSPYNAGLLSTYADEWKLPAEYTIQGSTLTEYFQVIDGYWEIRSISTASGEINTGMLSTGDEETLFQLKDIYSVDLDRGVYDIDKAYNRILEVLRGAPIENIDLTFEGLNTSGRVDRNGLIAAARLETLIEGLGKGDVNTTLSLPNIAYMDGLEYVVLFLFKLIMLVVLVIWMITIYLDTVGGHLNFKTIGKCLGVMLLTLSLVIVVPNFFELTYYQSNKLLLQDETEYMMMLNLEKEESGYEIGITEVSQPDTSTELYLKLDDIDTHWIDLFDDILTSSTFDSLENLYTDYTEQSFVQDIEGLTVMNDGVYISTSNLFESTDIVFNSNSKNIYQTANTGTEASFYTPYYLFLDSLIEQVNNYNSGYNVYAYSTKIQSGGKVKTLGIVKPFFESEEFTDSLSDVLNLYQIYGVDSPIDSVSAVFPSGSIPITQVRYSQWCNVNLDEQEIYKRIELILQRAREFVANNRNLIGKVTDETFLKAMALDLAIYHNKVFNTQRADAIEIYELSNEDLQRLSIASREEVMKNSPLSYSRFVYEVGGTTAVYAAAILAVVSFLASWVKPLATIAIFVVMFISIFIFKIILRRKSQGTYGYVLTFFLVCGMNIVYSLLIKLQVFLPSVGLTPTVCLIIQTLVQLLYMAAMLWVLSVAVKDWKNLGFQKFQDRFTFIRNKDYYRDHRTWRGPHHKDGWEYFYDLHDRQAERVGNTLLTMPTRRRNRRGGRRRGEREEDYNDAT